MRIPKIFKQKRWIEKHGGYCTFDDGRILKNSEVADFLRKKMSFWDRLNFDKVVDYAITTHAVMSAEKFEDATDEEKIAWVGEYTLTEPEGFGEV